VISGNIRRPWPDEVKEALEKFRLGDLIREPPFFYGHGGAIRLWNAGDDDSDEEAVALVSAVEELHPDDGPPFGIITTQTCDLDEQGAPMQPWFQVSPVYQLTGRQEDQAQLAAKQFTYELNGPQLPEGRWIADLRIELPLEKSLLAGREPIRAFASESDADAFARQLGRRRARAALANELVDAVIALLRARRSKRKGMWKNDVYRLMLEIEGGTRLAPAAVRLHVITHAEPTDEVRKFLDDWEDEAREPGAKVGIELWPTDYHDARSIALPEYDRWIELNLP
jgi:hypothetical protein